MRARLAHMNVFVDGLWLGTFHALCVRILRRFADRFSLGTNFTILDYDDQLRLIKQIIKAEKIDEKIYPFIKRILIF